MHRAISEGSKFFRFLRTPQLDKVDMPDRGVKELHGVHCSGSEREALHRTMLSHNISNNVWTGILAAARARARLIKARPRAARRAANTPRIMQEPQFALRGVLRADNARETAHVLSIELTYVNDVCRPLTALWIALDRRWSAGIVTSDLSMRNQTPRH